MKREPAHYVIFDSPIGACGLAWAGQCVVAVQLPEETDEATAARLTQKVPGALPSLASTQSAPTFVREAVEALVAALSGDERDLGRIPLALDGQPPFRRRVYEALRRVPRGRTLTYGELAEAAGSPGASRAVGQAMAHNPFALIVPCHRVVAAGGKLGGFSANGGVCVKVRLLGIER